MFALADRIESRLQTAQERVDRLTQSLLANAFRGELVPTEAELARQEGREYESAEELLARLSAVPEELGTGKSKGRRKGGWSLAGAERLTLCEQMNAQRFSLTNAVAWPACISSWSIGGSADSWSCVTFRAP